MTAGLTGNHGALALTDQFLEVAFLSVDGDLFSDLVSVLEAGGLLLSDSFFSPAL